LGHGFASSSDVCPAGGIWIFRGFICFWTDTFGVSSQEFINSDNMVRDLFEPGLACKNVDGCIYFRDEGHVSRFGGVRKVGALVYFVENFIEG